VTAGDGVARGAVVGVGLGCGLGLGCCAILSGGAC
jgi:hypothetical protein